MKFCVRKRICPRGIHVRFHAIQRSDRKIDDRFKQSLMTNQSNNLQQIVSINLKKQPSKTGCQVKEKCRSQCRTSGSDQRCSAAEIDNRFFLLTKRNSKEEQTEEKEKKPEEKFGI